MSNPFCKYKYLFGIPNQGIHQTRFLGLAVADVLQTAIAAFFISWFFQIAFWKCFIGLFVLGEILHLVFCIDTQFIIWMKNIFR